MPTNDGLSILPAENYLTLTDESLPGLNLL